MASSRFTRHPAPTGVRIGAPLVVGALLLLAWHAVVSTHTVPLTLLPTPGSVWSRLVHDIVHGELLARTATTIWEAVLGCIVATVFALPVGYLVARVRLAEAAISPYLAASQAIPAVALAPLLVIWVGYGLTPIVLLCSLIVFFPLLLSTVLGLRSIDHEVVEAAELDGASGWRMIRYIEAPLSRAALLSGVRNGFTLSVTGAVVGEFVMGGTGLGLVVSMQSASADTTGLFSTLIVLCVLAMVIYLGLIAVERLTDPYRVPRAAHPVPLETAPDLRLVAATQAHQSHTSAQKELVA